MQEIISLTPRAALTESYARLSPLADRQRWEFDSILFHLEYLTQHLPKTTTILDAGCGIGILVLALSCLGYEVEGVDKYVLNENAHYGGGDREKLTRIWGKENLVIRGEDMREAARSGRHYGACVSIAVIEHQQCPRHLIEDMMSCVEPGGYLYIATPNVANVLNRFRGLLGRAPLANIAEFYTEAENFIGHVREYTVRELEEMCRLSGLRVLDACAVETGSLHLSNNFRSTVKSIFRFLGRVVPESGDSTIVLAQK